MVDLQEEIITTLNMLVKEIDLKIFHLMNTLK